MSRAAGSRAWRTSLSAWLTYWLASTVIMIWMSVTPIPIRPLFTLFHLGERTILSVSLPEVLTIGTIFVVIPVVVVLVGAVIDPVAVLSVSMVFFLPSIVLWLGRSTNRHWGGKGRSKKKGTEKISITTVHFVFLLAQGLPLEILGRKEYAFVTA